MPVSRFSRQFGERVRKERLRRGLTQSQLADLASLGANYVPRLERGEMTPSIEAAFRLARVLGVSVDVLCVGGAASSPLRRVEQSLRALPLEDLEGARRALERLERSRPAVGPVAPRPARLGKGARGRGNER